MTGHDDLVLVPDFLRGWKVAHLIADPHGQVRFAGAMVHALYGPYDRAVCAADIHHAPPEPGCACGFYAFHERGRAVRLLDGEAAALLQVRMWGRFDEFELGFVAAAQQVVRVELLPYCTPCLVGRDGALVSPVAVGRREDSYFPALVPLCPDHVDGRTWTAEALAWELQVPCGWADPESGGLAGRLHDARRARFPSPLLPRSVRLLDDLLPGETAHVFADSIATDGSELWIDPLARLIQPMPGVDIPIRLGDDGIHEVLLDGIRVPGGFRPRHDESRYIVALRAVGQLTVEDDAPALDSGCCCEHPDDGDSDVE